MLNTELLVDRYLTTKTGYLPTGLLAIINTLYPKEVGDILAFKCPFCGRQFKSRQAMSAHLRRSHCRYMYHMMLLDIANTYKKVKYMVKRSDKVYVRYNGESASFNDIYDAYVYAVKLISKNKMFTFS